MLRPEQMEEMVDKGAEIAQRAGSALGDSERAGTWFRKIRVRREERVSRNGMNPGGALGRSLWIGNLTSRAVSGGDGEEDVKMRCNQTVWSYVRVRIVGTFASIRRRVRGFRGLVSSSLDGNIARISRRVRD